MMHIWYRTWALRQAELWQVIEHRPLQVKFFERVKLERRIDALKKKLGKEGISEEDRQADVTMLKQCQNDLEVGPLQVLPDCQLLWLSNASQHSRLVYPTMPEGGALVYVPIDAVQNCPLLPPEQKFGPQWFQCEEWWDLSHSQLTADWLQYVMHFPKGEKYVSLLKEATDAQTQAALDAERNRLRGLVRQRLADEKMLSEVNEGVESQGAPAPQPVSLLSQDDWHSSLQRTEAYESEQTDRQSCCIFRTGNFELATSIESLPHSVGLLEGSSRASRAFWE